jgi:hypothetical protein
VKTRSPGSGLSVAKVTAGASAGSVASWIKARSRRRLRSMTMPVIRSTPFRQAFSSLTTRPPFRIGKTTPTTSMPSTTWWFVTISRRRASTTQPVPNEMPA